MAEEKLAQIVALLHGRDLHSCRLAHLENLSAEQAATVLVDALQQTGYVEAVVSDLERTRCLVRRDCRRRRITVRTIAAGGRIVVLDQARRGRWL